MLTQLVPLCLSQHFLLSVDTSGVVEQRQNVDEIVVAPPWNWGRRMDVVGPLVALDFVNLHAVAS